MTKKDNTNGKNMPHDKKPGRFGLVNSIVTVMLVLFVLSTVYSYFAEQSVQSTPIAISELASDIGTGKVS